MFDEFANDIIRTTKGRKGYFIPAEEMLCRWLTDYAALTAEGESKLHEQIGTKKRQFSKTKLLPSWLAMIIRNNR